MYIYSTHLFADYGLAMSVMAVEIMDRKIEIAFAENWQVLAALRNTRLSLRREYRRWRYSSYWFNETLKWQYNGALGNWAYHTPEGVIADWRNTFRVLVPNPVDGKPVWMDVDHIGVSDGNSDGERAIEIHLVGDWVYVHHRYADTLLYWRRYRIDKLHLAFREFNNFYAQTIQQADCA